MDAPPDLDLDALEQQQRRLSAAVQIPSRDDEGYVPAPGDVIASLDIQYDGDLAHVGIDLHRWQRGHAQTYAGVTPATFPYAPGYFCFREGPPLLAALTHLEHMLDEVIALVIVDGHGLAHPRFFGVACWLGVTSGKPTVGSAKNTLVRFNGPPALERGSAREVFVDGRHVGHVLRTQTGIKPIYVSPGHRISLAQALACVAALPGAYRIPDPFRNADQAARARCRGDAPEGWIDLGEIPPTPST